MFLQLLVTSEQRQCALTCQKSLQVFEDMVGCFQYGTQVFGLIWLWCTENAIILSRKVE